MKIVNPIPGSQVVDVDVDFKCLDTPACSTLESVIQLLIDKVCETETTEEAAFGELDFKCLTAVTNQKDLNQAVIDFICGLTSGTTTTFTLNLNYCIHDLWNFTDDQCFVIEDCGIPVVQPTLEEVLQALIKRILRYQDLFILLENRINALEARVTNNELAIAQIQATCCP